MMVKCCHWGFPDAVNSLVMSDDGRDMARSRRRKDALERSERRLRLILQAARIGTWEWDFATNHIRWSEGIDGLFGLSQGLLPRNLDDFYRMVHVEDIGHIKGSIDRRRAASQ